MGSIKNMLPDNCLVLRDGIQISLHARGLVPGDIVYLRAGDKVPADLRFLQASSDARFDRSILTGESVPLAAVVDSTDKDYLETRCIGLQGSLCVSGTCIGLVVATGDDTAFGHIASLTNKPRTGPTPLEREINFFVNVICSIMLTMVVVALIVW
jgi:sodium/potassium-transporting ATPase subunit alpha